MRPPVFGRRRGIPGVHGGGQLGPVDADMRGAVQDEQDYEERPWYCNHTGSDYWPRPCNECIARSERGKAAS